MNKLVHPSLSALAAAALLLAVHGPVAAEGDRHAATGVGPAIAAQGNAALEQIREDLRRGLEQSLQPLSVNPPAQGLADAPNTEDTRAA